MDHTISDARTIGRLDVPEAPPCILSAAEPRVRPAIGPVAPSAVLRHAADFLAEMRRANADLDAAPRMDVRLVPDASSGIEDSDGESDCESGDSSCDGEQHRTGLAVEMCVGFGQVPSELDSESDGEHVSILDAGVHSRSLCDDDICPL